MTLRILNSALTDILSEIPLYRSLVMTRDYYTGGSLVLHVNREQVNVDDIKVGNYFLFGEKMDRIYRINDIVKTKDRQTEIVVKADHVIKLLNRRITVAPSGVADEDAYTSQTVEYIAKKWIENNITSPTDTDRTIDKFNIETNQDRGSTISAKTRLKKWLLSEVVELLGEDGIGLTAEYDKTTNKLDLDVYEGLDRTYGNGVNPAAIFSLDLKTLESVEVTNSETNAVNVAYVAGQGEGSSRTVEEVGTATGIDRIETFIDARDLETTAELQARGLQKIASFPESFSLEGRVLTNSTLEYETDWDLGDIVTFEDKEENTQVDKRILQVREIREEGKPFKIDVTFGKPLETVTDLIKRVETSIPVEGGGSGGGGDTGVPTGVLMAWPTDTAPTGWLICYGQAISRTTYADLFAVIGTTYGAGDGSTTFNVPGMNGRVVVGRSLSDTEFDTTGKTGGAKTHQLTIAEMPSHNHTIYGDNDSGPDGGDTCATDDVPDTALEDGTCSYVGGDEPHNNLQPYIVMRWIIKT